MDKALKILAKPPIHGCFMHLMCDFLAAIAVKLGVGGFSMGAAAALYSATCCANGKYGNGKPYPVNLSAVVGLSGWLPCARYL